MSEQVPHLVDLVEVNLVEVVDRRWSPFETLCLCIWRKASTTITFRVRRCPTAPRWRYATCVQDKWEWERYLPRLRVEGLVQSKANARANTPPRNIQYLNTKFPPPGNETKRYGSKNGWPKFKLLVVRRWCRLHLYNIIRLASIGHFERTMCK